MHIDVYDTGMKVMKSDCSRYVPWPPLFHQQFIRMQTYNNSRT